MSYGELASREYKIMLDPNRFGPSDQLEKVGGAFWSELMHVGNEFGVTELSDKPDWEKPELRRVSFWDTARHDLQSRDYVLRRRESHRKKNGDKKVKATLKRRHADRVIAADIHVSKSDAFISGPSDGEIGRKFEEDVKPIGKGRQRSLFSHSLTWKNGKDDIQLDRVDRVERLFPGFADAVGLDLSDSLVVVGRGSVDEYVLTMKKNRLHLSGAPDVSIDAALVAWYESGCQTPAVVEFSYRYEGTEVDFSPGAAAGAADLLRLLDVELFDWRSATNLTKTQWMYSSAVPRTDRRRGSAAA